MIEKYLFDIRATTMDLMRHETTPQLFARASGRPVTPGSCVCATCGGSCVGMPVASLIDDWAGWDRAADRSSNFVCSGCYMTARCDNRADWPRLYSWVITAECARRFATGKAPVPQSIKTIGDDAAKAYRRQEMTELTQACLSPPLPPYSIVLTSNNSKNYLYFAKAGTDPAVATVNLDGTAIIYEPMQLVDRLSLVMRIIAAAGRPSVQESPNGLMLGIALESYWTDWEIILDHWLAVHAEPLSRLACFLAPTKEFCQNEHPSDKPIAAAPAAAEHGRVQTKTGGAVRSKPAIRGLFGKL